MLSYDGSYRKGFTCGCQRFFSRKQTTPFSQGVKNSKLSISDQYLTISKDYLKKEGFKATLDFPIICLIDELLPEFPDAKVLLNVRDSPETWVKES